MMIWTNAFIIGICVGVMLLKLIWLRYEDRPMITTIENYYYPIQKVDFPILTICNVNKVYEPATRNIRNLL